MLMTWEEMGMSDVISNRGAGAPQSQDGGTTRARRGLDLRAVAGLGGVASLCGAIAAAGVMLKPESAAAVPSFARQTGQPCATCHTMWPQLTAYGRRFKLGGYQLGGGLSWDEALPVSSFAIFTFTHQQSNLDPGVYAGTQYHSNNNPAVNQVTGLYAGLIPVPGGGLGAFMQYTYDGPTGKVYFDQSDIRYVKDANIMGLNVTWALDATNTPQLEDPWSTSYGFNFAAPGGWAAPPIGPAFGTGATLLDSGALALGVVGTGGYVWINDSIYMYASVFQNLSHQTMNFLGYPASPAPGSIGYAASGGAPSITGAAPYWRAAYEATLPHDQYLEIGTGGIYAQTLPGRVQGFGTDNLLDIQVDMQYQWLGDPWNFTLRATNVHEYQTLNSTFNQGAATNLYGWANSLNINAEIVYDKMWNLTFGYFNFTGSSDALLYRQNSLVSSPNGEGLILDLSYMPFAHGGPKEIWPWLNARIGIDYTTYLKINGGNNNFDGVANVFYPATGNFGGGHNAGQNNTLMLYTWVDY